LPSSSRQQVLTALKRSALPEDGFNLLKKAARGKYRVYVNYFSAREFAATGPVTVMAEIFTKYGSKTEQRQIVSLQLPNAERSGSNKVLVAEFEF